MPTFKYTVMPTIEDGKLCCDFEILSAIDANLKVNADDYMHYDIERRLREDPKLYDVLEYMAKTKVGTPLVFDFILFFSERHSIPDVGTIELNVPLRHIDTSHQLRTCVQEFIERVVDIIKEDSL